MSKDLGRRRLVVVLIAAAVACIGLVVTIVLSGSNRVAGQPVAASSSASVTATPDTATGEPSEQGGPVVTGSGGSELPPPTGAKVPQLSEFKVGDCADPRTSEDHTVTMFEADCADATFALDQVATGNCPLEHFAGVGPEGTDTYCFTWLVDVGDCVNVERWYRVPCGTGAEGESETSKVVDVKIGEADGQTCEQPDMYLQAGQAATRGIACYVPETADDSSDGSVPTTTAHR